MYIIGISGLSGSGKSSVSKAILKRFHGQVGVLEHDMYYHAKKNKPAISNYDHPDALETGLLIQHLGDLRCGKTIRRPIYDFKISDRVEETVEIQPHPIMIVEGLLIFCIPELMPVFDLRVYIDVPLDIAIIRRIKRDHIERGRTMKSIIEQYEHSVREAAIALVQPSRYLADIIIPQGITNRAGLEVVYGKINDLLSTGHPSGLIRTPKTVPPIDLPVEE
jgi:uridine kinase